MPSHHARLDEAPWWRGAGEERCPHCLQAYFYEQEVRCTACDGPMCPHCTVRQRSARITLCAGCHEPGDAPEGA